MSGVWAVIPLKLERHPKRRLGGLLSLTQRRALQRMMAEDVLRTACSVHAIDGILIVSDSDRAGELANAYDAQLLIERSGAPPGLNSAVNQAARYLVDLEVAAMMVIHADLPLLSEAEVKSLLQNHTLDAAGRGLSIVPDRFETGSNCLLCTPPDLIRFRFGPDSFVRHLAEARRAGVHVTVSKLPGGSLDVDTPADVAELMRRHTPTGSKAGAFLSRRLPEIALK